MSCNWVENNLFKVGIIYDLGAQGHVRPKACGSHGDYPLEGRNPGKPD